jgi:hypothetical protein
MLCVLTANTGPSMSRTWKLSLFLVAMLPMATVGAWSELQFGSPPNEPSACEDLSAIPQQYNIDYADIHNVWLQGGCTGCHNGTAMGGLRLDVPSIGISQLVNQPSYRNNEIIRVIPANPDYSQIYQMLNCAPPATYQEMPPSMGGGRIAAELRALLYDWIAEGARGLDEDGNPISDIVFVSRFESQRFQRGL